MFWWVLLGGGGRNFHGNWIDINYSLSFALRTRDFCREWVTSGWKWWKALIIFKLLFFSVIPRRSKTEILLPVRTKQLGCCRKTGDVGWPVGDLNKTSEPGDLKDYLRFLLFLGIVLWTRNKLVLRATGDLASASPGVSPLQAGMEISQKLLQYNINPQGRIQGFPYA